MNIRIFAYRGPFYYGFGIDPESAIEQAIRAGMSRKKIQKGQMHRLPEGVIRAEVDQMGGLSYYWPDGVDASKMERAKRMYYNAATNDWQDDEPVADPDATPTPKFRVHFIRKIVGFVDIEAEDQYHAMEEVEFLDTETLAKLMEEEGTQTKVEVKVEVKRF